MGGDRKKVLKFMLKRNRNGARGREGGRKRVGGGQVEDGPIRRSDWRHHRFVHQTHVLEGEF